MKSFLKRWMITTLGVLVAIQIVPGIQYTRTGLVVATLLLALLNVVVRPILIVFALPLVVLTLGLFVFIINALLLWWVGHLQDFQVDSFWHALLCSLIINTVSLLLNYLTGTNDNYKVRFSRNKRPPPPPPSDGGGPVIDV